MLPDYVIHKELERLRSEGCREKRLEIGRPTIDPRQLEEILERSREYNYPDGEKIEYHEIILKM